MIRTPEFTEHLSRIGAQWGEWRGQAVVELYRDAADEYRALREEAGLVDLSERETLVITGDDAVPWLQGLVTNDIFDLAEEGAGQWNTAVGTTGRLIADMVLLHMPEMLVVDLEAGLTEELLPHLRRHVIMEKVRLTDRSPQTARLGLYGPRAAALLGRLASTEHPLSSRGGWAGTWGMLGEADVVIQHSPRLGVEGFEISCSRDQALDVWRALEEAGATPAGQTAFEIVRLESGLPRFGVELDEKTIPLEAPMHEAISFDKGCYLGQEIITRLDTLGTPARRLRTIVLDGTDLPPDDADVTRETKSVGKLLRAIYSPLHDRALVAAWVKRNHNDLGTPLEVGGLPGKIVR